MQTKFNIGDKVKILDGSDIDGYMGQWTPRMDRLVGRIVTIDQIRITDKGVGYLTEETIFSFDERGLELTDDEDDKETELDDNLLLLTAIFAELL